MTKLDLQETANRIHNLRRYQALPLDAKIRYSNRLIEVGLELAQRPIVAWSGGKDSMVLLHLILQYHPTIDVNFNNTGVEYPESLQHVKRMRREWNLNLHTTRPGKRDFWWCVENRGFPLLGKAFTSKTSFFQTKKQDKVMRSGASISGSCCWYCKEKPAIDLRRRLGADLVFLGVMAEESRLRKFKYVEQGDFRWNVKEEVWKLHPLSIWTEADIWAYTTLHDIPVCELYRMGHKRNGCWPCGMDISFPDNNHLATLRRTHPKLWRFLMIDKGLGDELLKIKLALNDGQLSLFYANRNLEELLEQRPCFFDRL